MARLALVSLILAAGLTCAAPPAYERGDVQIELLLEGRPVPGLIRAEDLQGAPIALEGLLSRGLGLADNHPAHRWSVLPGPARVSLPRVPLRISAFHGLETALATVDFPGGRELRIPLRRLRAVDWKSANTHLHLQKVSRALADRYLAEVPRADGLDALFVSHLERAEADRDYISNAYTESDLRILTERTGVVFGNGEEHRHNFTPFGEGYGHAMFLDLRKLVRPVSLGPGITRQGTDGVPLRRGIDEARKDGATILWCHNTFGLEDIPSWVAGRPHAQNIFDGDPDAHGSYEHTYYRYLNAGLRVPFSTGTDWFIYDFSRVYAPVASLKTPRDWLRALEAGRTFITNGPLLEFEVDGRAIGETVKLEKPGRLNIRGHGTGRVNFSELQLVRNGQVVHASPAGFEIELDVTEPCWLALRTPPPPTKEKPDPSFPKSELGGPLFAHTSPIYVEVAGRAIRKDDALRGLLDEVRRARETILKTARFADEHERRHVLDLYDQAAATIERMLKP